MANRRSRDKEIVAISKMMKILEEFDLPTRQRVMNYLSEWNDAQDDREWEPTEAATAPNA